MSPTDQHQRRITHDETIEVESKGGGSLRYRARIWQGPGCSTVVLIGQCFEFGDESVMPCHNATRIAQYVTEVMLRHPASPVVFFMDEKSDTPWPGLQETHRIYSVEFRMYGHAMRLRYYFPVSYETSWSLVESLVGKFER